MDIQPIACQIAKLRFFISLAIEQDSDPSEPNLGIKPLPNLETRFVAADALMGFQSDPAFLLFDDVVASKQKEVASVRERYFLADSRPKKLECVETDHRLRRELRDLFESERRAWVEAHLAAIENRAKDFPNPKTRDEYRTRELRKFAVSQRRYDSAFEDARKVAEWDPYDQNGSASWFVPQYMFGVAGGFDVVIGNPPYIQLQKDRGRAGKRYQSADFATFARTGDIYQLFYERGCRLLKSDTGALTYITSNSWLKAEYGKSLRRWFTECHTPLRLIEMGKDVFDAIVDTGVLVVREGGSALRVPAVDIDHLDGGDFPPPQNQWGEVRLDGSSPWSVLSDVEWNVFEKMRRTGVPLTDWDVRINYGIKTGYNDGVCDR